MELCTSCWANTTFVVVMGVWGGGGGSDRGVVWWGVTLELCTSCGANTTFVVVMGVWGGGGVWCGVV